MAQSRLMSSAYLQADRKIAIAHARKRAPFFGASWFAVWFYGSNGENGKPETAACATGSGAKKTQCKA
jgi:hypothetical protein